MKTRKIVLLSGIGILLIVYILQLCLGGKSSAKTFTLKDEVVNFTISNNGSDVKLSKSGEDWQVSGTNGETFKANSGFADSIQTNVSEIKTLDIVSHSDDNATLERYGLSNPIKVEGCTADGNVARTILVGKESATGSQTYVKIDSSKDIYLVSGNLKSVFGKSVDDLRTKEVFRFDGKEITKVEVSKSDQILTFVKKDANAELPEWEISGTTETLDQSKVTSWIESLPVLSAEKWGAKGMPEVGDSQGVKVTISTANKTVDATVYQTGEGNEAKYFATSSENPYNFEVSGYMAQKFLKNVEDLK